MHHKQPNHHKNSSHHYGYYGDLKSSQLHSRRKRSIGKADRVERAQLRGCIMITFYTI